MQNLSKENRKGRKRVEGMTELWVSEFMLTMSMYCMWGYMGSMYVSMSALNDSSIFIDNPTPSTTSFWLQKLNW